MLKKYIEITSKLITGLSFLFITISISYIYQRNTNQKSVKELEVISSLPKNSFEQIPSTKKAPLPELPFDIEFSPLKMQLPNLQKTLIFLGSNNRPDAKKQDSLMHFTIQGTSEKVSTTIDAPIYLTYNAEDKSRYPYSFSEKNIETSLWFTADQQAAEAKIHLFMRNEEGAIIQEPDEHAHFSLKEQKTRQYRKERWMIGSLRVDPTLLVRQKAKWYGRDLFLKEHGGEDYAEEEEKQLIYFQEKENSYPVAVGGSSVLIFKEGVWQTAIPDNTTVKYPLIVQENIDERILKLKIFDIDGKRKLPLNLIRARELFIPKVYSKTFKCVGARTRSQFTFEIDGARKVLTKGDWLLETDQGWIFLDSEEQIDAFVEHELEGTLFIFNGPCLLEGEPILSATMYSPKRTISINVEIPLPQGSVCSGLIEEYNNEDEDFDDEDM